MIERINEQPTPDESTLRLKGVYHDRRSGKDRRIGYTVIDPVSDRRKRDRRKFGYHSDSELKRNYLKKTLPEKNYDKKISPTKDGKALKAMNVLHVSSKLTATFTCPECKRSKNFDASKFIKASKKVTIKIKCPCGYHSISYLNFRRQHRKSTDLNGTYSIITNRNDKTAKKMKVCDLSIIGMKLKIKTDENLSVGDVLSVEFYLDDIHRSFIHKKVTVRNISPGYVGTEFHGREIVGKALGFYLYFK